MSVSSSLSITHHTSTGITSPTEIVLPTVSPLPAECSTILDGVARAERFCSAEAQGKMGPGADLTQEGVNTILLDQARCECKRAYSGIRPDVQLAFGRCAETFASPDAARTFSRRVTQCLDGDVGGLAMDRGFSLSVDGTLMAYSNAAYEAPRYNESLRPMRATSDAITTTGGLLSLTCFMVLYIVAVAFLRN
jgi:hypothetical protein